MAIDVILFRLLMIINGYWYLLYLWLLMHVNGYSINNLLVLIVLMAIGGYSINGYWWLFY
jgi:hypothetical protein